MRRYALRDDQWDRIKNILPGREGHVGVTAKDNRLFVEAVIYRYRACIPWRDLPERFGKADGNSGDKPIPVTNLARLIDYRLDERAFGTRRPSLMETTMRDGFGLRTPNHQSRCSFW